MMPSQPNLERPPQAQEQRLLEAALALATEAERLAFLNSVADPELRQRLEGLIAASVEADAFFGAPPPQALDSEPSGPTAVAPVTTESSAVMGRYKLLEKIGEGGFGDVWMAEQREPVKRRVALKVLKPGMDSRQIISRFEGERQALAIMDHPNIAKILDAGVTETGRPYFVMELVRGIQITEYCDQNQLTTRQRLELFIRVCNAIQHAHQKGIIHRDIKPSNILVTLNDGEAVPKVIDFGIAKATQGELTDKTVFTQFQQFIGTPAYISPEQAEMSSLDIDTRADIYSLGVLLYELLVGQTPFDAREMMKGGLDALRRMIREQEPQRPSTKLNTLSGDAKTTAGKRRQTDAGKLMHQLQGDLDWIVMKCLEKDRTRRYDTATGLAADIQRHLTNEPVVARPPNLTYKIQKTWQRNKLVFTAATATALAMVVGTSISTWQALRATQAQRAALTAQAEETAQRRSAEKHKKLAENAEMAARRRAYASDINGAQDALANENFGRARELLHRHRSAPGEPDLRGWEWRYLWQFCRSHERSVLQEPRTTAIQSVALSENGEWAAVGPVSQGELAVYHLPRKERILVPAGQHGRLRMAFSPRAPLLAFTVVNPRPLAPPFVWTSRVLLWDLNERRVIREFGVQGTPDGLSFSEDGQTLVVGSGTWVGGAQVNEVSLWRVADGSKIAGWKAGISSFSVGSSWFAATRDASAAAVVAPGHKISVIDLKSGVERWNAVASEDDLKCLAFSPDGRVLASGAGFLDSTIALWDAHTGRPLGRLKGQKSWTSCLTFLADSKHLVTGSGDQTLRLWDLETRSVVRTFHGHRFEVYALALGADQRTLLSGCKGGTALFWDLGERHDDTSRGTVGSGIACWSFAEGGKALVTLDFNGRVVRRDGLMFQHETPLFVIGALGGGIREGGLRQDLSVMSSSHPYLAAIRNSTSNSAAKIQIWNWEHRLMVREWDCEIGHRPQYISKDGARFLVTGRDGNQGRLWEWDIATGREIRSFQLPAGGYQRGFAPISPDGTRFLSDVFADTGTVQLDMVTGRRTRWDVKVPQINSQPVFSPDGHLVALASNMGYAKVYDTESFQEKTTLSGLTFGAHSAAFSPDQQRLAIGGTGFEAVTLWDLVSSERLLTLAAPVGAMLPVGFSPDGNVLLGQSDRGAHAGTLHFWRAPSWEEIAATEAKDPTSFDGDGRDQATSRRP
jgi:serine/threonine protein kinase/WD40 repeat protein